MAPANGELSNLNSKLRVRGVCSANSTGDLRQGVDLTARLNDEELGVDVRDELALEQGVLPGKLPSDPSHEELVQSLDLGENFLLFFDRHAANPIRASAVSCGAWPIHRRRRLSSNSS